MSFETILADARVAAKALDQELDIQAIGFNSVTQRLSNVVTASKNSLGEELVVEQALVAKEATTPVVESTPVEPVMTVQAPVENVSVKEESVANDLAAGFDIATSIDWDAIEAASGGISLGGA